MNENQSLFALIVYQAKKGDSLFENIPIPERAIAVGYNRKGFNRKIAEEHLLELVFLAETAGAEVVETFFQEVERIHPGTAIGKGKVEEIQFYIEMNDIQLVIFDDDLSPVQAKNLENAFTVKVIDRSWLILDIFALRAQSVEAKTQVELAQLKYLQPRLTRMWTHLSKQYGGIGTKGPGETQIETDRRIIKTRIQKLEKKLQHIEIQRKQQRKGRDKLPRFALVGYTNAGKSTLMNVLTDSGVYTEDKLFATLDTTIRTFTLPEGNTALISDTVGFIRKLPAHLIASFRSTLAEVSEADILVHVLDISNSFVEEQYQVVKETLKELGVKDKPTILVLNKSDIIEDRSDLIYFGNKYKNSILISAKRSINILALLEEFKQEIENMSNLFDILLPYSESALLSKLYAVTTISERNDTDDGYVFKVSVNNDKKELFNSFFKKYIV
jgi:GTP-binding protein HflX